VIRLESVTVAFGKTIAIDGIDMTIDPGITGLFGPNGSGKSTLLRVVAGLLRPGAGRITVVGVDPRSESGRRLIGYAGHATGLYRDLTIVENLGLFARLYGASPARVDDVVEILGLTAFASKITADLSAGTARRAGVARALVHDPAVLLLDEPYANVDVDAAELMSSAIRAWRGPDKVALVASHGAKKVKAYADAGVILLDGHVRTAGRYSREAIVR
jgi:ABC-type multidrug transport system ATPase subunit